jgi:RNA 3'-terminal phosphate cyclase (ATP)
MSDVLRIDGATGEGGGQILRTSLALSAITGTPIVIENIRAGRPKPGLMQQHLTCVNAAATVCGASVSGAAVGSQNIVFRPGSLRGGRYQFAVGTAGSALLVFQTVLPMLLRADRASELEIVGGTHNRHSPPYDFVANAFVQLLASLGLDVSLTLARHGFEPAGNGRVVAKISPSRASSLSLLSRGPVRAVRGRALVANLPPSVGERQVDVLRRGLREVGAPSQISREPVAADGSGNAVVVEVISDAVTEVFTGFGGRHGAPEAAARDACAAAVAYARGDVPVSEYLADQLLLPLALGAGGEFRTVPPSRHTETNAEVIARFLPVRFRLGEVIGVSTSP